MRLVCPNCDAQYEVADNAVPEAGRDVQCSNCGHAWFQMPPVAQAEEAEEAALFGDDIAAVMAAEAKPEPAVASVSPAAFPAEEDLDDDDDAPTAPPAGMAPPRSIDESLMAVLREEAEREMQARKAEAARPIETQTDLGLDDVAPAPALSATQRRLAMLQGKDPEVIPPPPKPAARRDLLPDVEEINSTLRSSSSSRDDEEDVDTLPDLTQRKGGFRSGFALMLVLAVLVIVAYVAAPQLAEQFPAAAGGLQAFASAVDMFRLWINGVMESATNALNGRGGA